MHCGKCGSVEYHKSGFTNGKQRYKCKACAYHFTRSYGRGQPPEKKLMALRLYKEGVGFCGIGRLLGVSDVAVLKWIRKMGQELRDMVLSQMPEDIESIEIIELDEMWHFTQKKRTSSGYGLLCLASQDASSPWQWALVAPKRLRNSGTKSNT